MSSDPGDAVPPDPPAARWSVGRVLAPALFLLCVGLHWHSLSYPFLDWDDVSNVVENPHIRRLDAGNLKWMFTRSLVSDYKPLVWISYTLDLKLWGLSPAGFRLVNLLLHGANTLFVYALVFALASRARGAAPATRGAVTGVAGLLAAVFAVHPQRVESVVWISERKDVLCAFFFLSSLLLYARRPRAGRSAYGGWLALFSLAGLAAMLCKAVAVILPFALLWMDLCLDARDAGSGKGRWAWGVGRLAEKAPLIACAVLVGIKAWSEQADDPANNLMVAAQARMVPYVVMLNVMRTFWPWPLSPLYPQHAALGVSAVECAAAGAAVVLITAAVWRAAVRGNAWPLLGWGFFGIALAPTLPIRHIADRFMYLPSIGLLALPVLAWGAWIGRMRVGRAVAGVAAAVALLILAGGNAGYSRVWSSSLRLWLRAVEQSPEVRSWFGLAVAEMRAGDLDAAARAVERVFDLDGDFAPAFSVRGDIHLRANRLDDAIHWLRQAVALKPELCEAWQNLGVAFARSGRLDQAVEAWEQALARCPDNVTALNNLGRAMEERGRSDEARACYERVLAIRPDLEGVAESLDRLDTGAAGR